MKITVCVSYFVFASLLGAGPVLKQFHPRLSSLEMELLQKRVDALAQDTMLEGAVDFFVLSCFGTRESKTAESYLGSVPAKTINSGETFVLDNSSLRVRLEGTFSNASAGRLKLDYALKSGNKYPLPLPDSERGPDILTAEKHDMTYLHVGVPEPVFSYDVATLSGDLQTLTTTVDATRMWIVAISRHTTKTAKPATAK